MSDTTTRAAASPNRVLAVVLGVIFVVIGALGFTVTGGVGFFSTTGGLLFGIFGVNALHTIAHIVVGAALAMAGLSGVPAARTVNRVVGTLFLVIGLAGLYVVGTPANILALTLPDQVLHLAAAVLLLSASLGAEQPRRQRGA